MLVAMWGKLAMTASFGWLTPLSATARVCFRADTPFHFADRKVASATLNQDAKPSELEAFYTDRRPASETTWNAKEQHGGCQQSN